MTLAGTLRRRLVLLLVPPMLAASLVPCLCPALPGPAAGEHGCCAPPAGIGPAAREADCCASMRQHEPTLAAAAHELAGPALSAFPRPAPVPEPATAFPPPAPVSPSPPRVLRI